MVSEKTTPFYLPIEMVVISCAGKAQKVRKTGLH